MPSKPDQPFDYDTMKLRAVFVPDDAKDKVSNADIIGSMGYDSVKIPAVFVPQGGKPPGFPYEHFGRTEFRPDEDSAARGTSTSDPSSSQPSDAEEEGEGEGEEEDGEPAATLPRTRYRFGAALSGGRQSGPPPHPALAAGRGDPGAAGIAVWRGMETPGAVWRQSHAAASAMRDRATAAASETKVASTASDGDAGVRDAPGQLGPFQPDPFGQAMGSNVDAHVQNDPLNRTDPTRLLANVGTGVTAALQGEGEDGSGSIVQAQYAPAGPLPAPLAPVVLPGTPENNDFVNSTIHADKTIVNAIGNILNAERSDESASQTPPAGDLQQTSMEDLQAAAKADGYSSIEEWKPQELQLDSRFNIVKDSDGNLYSVPRRGEDSPQPLDIKLPQ